MKEYIEREALLEEDFTDIFVNSYDANVIFPNIIEAAPVADVEPVRHGIWINEDTFDAHYQPIYTCSNCHKSVADEFIHKHKYCLHCGAKMDGGNKREVGFYREPKNYNISQRLASRGNK